MAENAWVLNDTAPHSTAQQFAAAPAAAAWGWFGMPVAASLEFATAALPWAFDFHPSGDLYLWLAQVGGGFPAQFFGLKAFFQSAIKDLCLVAEADAPTGMGGVFKVRKGAVNYAIYLVETTDPNASPIRVRTSTGTKAIRLKT